MGKPFTTEDLKKHIAIMEDEELSLNAPLLVQVDGKEYQVMSMGHFHIVPNVVIGLELKAES